MNAQGTKLEHYPRYSQGYSSETRRNPSVLCYITSIKKKAGELVSGSGQEQGNVAISYNVYSLASYVNPVPDALATVRRVPEKTLKKSGVKVSPFLPRPIRYAAQNAVRVEKHSVCQQDDNLPKAVCVRAQKISR